MYLFSERFKLKCEIKKSSLFLAGAFFSLCLDPVIGLKVGIVKCAFKKQMNSALVYDRPKTSCLVWTAAHWSFHTWQFGSNQTGVLDQTAKVWNPLLPGFHWNSMVWVRSAQESSHCQKGSKPKAIPVHITLGMFWPLVPIVWSAVEKLELNTAVSWLKCSMFVLINNSISRENMLNVLLFSENKASIY